MYSHGLNADATTEMSALLESGTWRWPDAAQAQGPCTVRSIYISPRGSQAPPLSFPWITMKPWLAATRSHKVHFSSHSTCRVGGARDV